MAKQKHLSISILNKIQRLVIKKMSMGSSFTRVRYMQQGKSINYGEKDAICAMLRVKNTEVNAKTLFS